MNTLYRNNLDSKPTITLSIAIISEIRWFFLHLFRLYVQTEIVCAFKHVQCDLPKQTGAAANKFVV